MQILFLQVYLAVALALVTPIYVMRNSAGDETGMGLTRVARTFGVAALLGFTVGSYMLLATPLAAALALFL